MIKSVKHENHGILCCLIHCWFSRTLEGHSRNDMERHNYDSPLHRAGNCWTKIVLHFCATKTNTSDWTKTVRLSAHLHTKSKLISLIITEFANMTLWTVCLLIIRLTGHWKSLKKVLWRWEKLMYRNSQWHFHRVNGMVIKTSQPASSL